MNDIRLGLIGYGNMAGALVQGWLNTQTLKPEQIYACSAHPDVLAQKLKGTGMHAMENAAQVIEACSVLVLAVKPNVLEQALEGCAGLVKEQMVISIAAGKPYDAIEALLPGSRHISIMPNTPVAAGQGIVIAEEENSLTPEQMETFHALFSSIALVETAAPAQFSAAGTLAGCSPAFAAMFIEALADAGVKHGLKRQTAYSIAAKVLEGTGALYFLQDGNPASMKDAVCSPGGTTIKGVSALEKRGFRGDIIDAIDAIEGE